MEHEDDIPKLKRELGSLRLLASIGRDAIEERNYAENKLAEARELLEAYGGGIPEIESWLERN